MAHAGIAVPPVEEDIDDDLIMITHGRLSDKNLRLCVRVMVRRPRRILRLASVSSKHMLSTTENRNEFDLSI